MSIKIHRRCPNALNPSVPNEDQHVLTANLSNTASWQKYTCNFQLLAK